MDSKIKTLLKSYAILKALIKAKDTPIDMTAEEAVEEHKHLVHVLETPSYKDDIQEAKKQKKELKEYKEKLAESELKKAPLIGDYSSGIEEGSSKTKRNITQISPRAISNQIGNVTIHSVGNNDFMSGAGQEPLGWHYITHNNKPDGQIISYIKVVGADHSSPKGPYIAEAYTDKHSRGLGLSSVLHQHAANHHGVIYSDTSISPAEHAVWQRGYKEGKADLSPTHPTRDLIAMDPLPTDSDYESSVSSQHSWKKSNNIIKKADKIPHPFKVGDRVVSTMGPAKTGTVTAIKTESGRKHKMKVKHDDVGVTEYDKVGHGGKWDLWDHAGYWTHHNSNIKKSYSSEAQRKWAHTSAGKEALGAETVAHYDKESKDLDLPEKIEKGAQGDWETEGYKIIYEGFDENYKNKEGVAGHVFQVAHPKHGNVGQVVFTINPHTGNLNPIPYINKEHRRKGLATEIYKRAEKELGLKVEIGSKQSPDASLFWSQPNRPFGKADGLEKGAQGDWKKEGYTFHHTVDTFGSLNPQDHQHRITAHDSKKNVAGSFIFEYGRDNAWHATSSQVGPEHRRKGLANAAYRLFEQKTGHSLTPHHKQSEYAQSLWQQPNRPFGKSDELEKGAARRLYGPFDPLKEIGDDRKMSSWVSGSTDEDLISGARGKLPDPSPNARLRFVNKLARQTQTRLNPNTKQREFLLHRQMSQPEAQSTINGDKINHSGTHHSSWTPSLDRLTNIGIYSRSSFDPDDRSSYSHIISAWIPESHLKTMPMQYGQAGTYDPSKRGKPTHNAKMESEVIVKPGHNSEIQAIHRDSGINPHSWNWQKVFGKSEDLFKCLIDLSLLEDDILTKADEQNRPPRFVGDRHPDPQKGWVGAKHPNGILMWHQPPGRAAAHDKFINDPKNKEKILNRFKSDTHRKIMAQVMDNTIKDPNRHFIPSEENGRQRLRARHLKSLINNENHIRIDESDPNILHLERDTHSQGQNKGQKSHLYYKGVTSGTSVKKSEGLYRPGTPEFMEILWRRDPSSARPGQYELCAEQDTTDSRVDAGNDYNRRSYNKERLNKSYMKRHLEDIGHFNPIPDWQKSYLSKSEDQYVYHYSPHAGLKTLDPKHMRTGAKGAFSSKFNPSKIPDFPHVLFTYMHDAPEDIVKQPAVSKYMIKLNPDHIMYDIGKDEHGLVKQAIQENQGVYNYENVFKKIKDAGFHGIVNPNHDNPVVKNTALLFYPQQVHSETSAK